MKLHEEFKLYETMWDDAPSSEAPTESRYIILTGDFPNKYYVHGLTSDGEKEAVDIYNNAMAQLPNSDCDIEVAELFDLTSDEINRLESMVGKEVTGADADFIADFFTDGSRVDSRYNNFSESSAVNKAKLDTLTEEEDPYGYGPYKTFSDPTLKVGDYVLAPRSFSADKHKTYPAKITAMSDRWINYEISGFGFSDKGTKARPGSKAASTISNAKKYLSK